MKIIFFDTETSGLPKNYNAPHTDTDNFPFLVQIAWVVCDADGEELKSEVFIIKPEGFTIPPNMIHGISHEKALNEGVDLETVLKKFAADLDEATVVVAHNMNFDSKIVGAECVRKGIPYKLFEKELICTMQTTADIDATKRCFFELVETEFGYENLPTQLLAILAKRMIENEGDVCEIRLLFEDEWQFW